MRTAPGFDAKPSISFTRVSPDTYWTGITVNPYPASTSPFASAWSMLPTEPSVAGIMR